MIDIGRALQHPFQDQDWPRKIGLGALILCVPILNFAAYGYLLEHLRNTQRGADLPLPEWSGTLGDKFTEGLKYFVVVLIYSLPIVLLSCILSVAFGGVAALSSRSGNNSDAASVAGAGVGILSLAFLCLIFLYALFLFYVYPALTIRFAQTRDIGACLQLGEIFALARRNTGDYVLIFVVLFGINFVAGLVSSVLISTLILACIGLPLAVIAQAYTNIVAGYLCGQYARDTSLSGSGTPGMPVTPVA